MNFPDNFQYILPFVCMHLQFDEYGFSILITPEKKDLMLNAECSNLQFHVTCS